MIYPIVFGDLILQVLEEEFSVELQKKERKENKTTCMENNFSVKGSGRKPTS